MRIRVLTGLAFATILIGGCSSSTPSEAQIPDSEATTTFVEQASQAMTEARAAGASDLQLSIIEEAIRTGEISLEQYREALDEYSACLDIAGLRLVDMGVTDRNGFPMPDYGTEAGDSPEDMALMDACDAKHLFWANMLYQIQPAALAAGETAFDSALPELIACLQEGGVILDDNATADEVQQIMLQFMRDHSPAYDPAECSTVDGVTTCTSTGDPAPEDPMTMIVPNCLQESGIDGF